MYSAMQIAHYIIDFSNRNNKPVSNLALQKILYFLQVFYMRKHNHQRLFAEEIQAWSYGPVVPEVYYTYNGYGGLVIRNSYDVTDISVEDQNYMNPIILRLGQMGVWDLVDMSHAQGGPWDRVYQDGAGNHQVIPTDLFQYEQNVIS